MDPSVILDTFPALGIILASGAVLTAGEVVRSAVEWTKVRLRRRWPDVPHAAVHASNAVFSLLVGLAFVQTGQLVGDEAFIGLSWPLNWLAFSAAVALRAGGAFDLQKLKVDPVATTLALVASGQSPNAGAWIVDTVKGLVPRNKVTAALEVLAPTIKQFAGALLTDELRGELQTKIHTTLRKAGLLKGRDLA